MSTSTKEQVEQAPGEGTGTPFSVWLALVVGFFVAFSWLFQSGWMVVTGIFLIVTAWCLLISPERRLTLIIVLIILAILTAVGMPNYIKIKDKAKNAEIKQNLHAIQLGLERYAVDHDGQYPLAIDELREESYMPVFPINPFMLRLYHKLNPGAYGTRDAGIKNDTTGAQELKWMQPLGADYYSVDHKDLLSPIGNFCYVPQIEAGADGELIATGYLLIGFGQKRWHPDWTAPRRNIPIVLMQLTNPDQQENDSR